MIPSTLTATQRVRYSRQRLLAAIGDEGQLRICMARVSLVVALHPAERVALIYLVAAGVGELELVAQAHQHAAAILLGDELRRVRQDLTLSVRAAASAEMWTLAPLPPDLDLALQAAGQCLKALAAAR